MKPAVMNDPAEPDTDDQPGAGPDPNDPTPADGSGAMAPGEICVPIAALAQPDEQEQMQPPAVGDKASAQVDYTVTRVEGDNAYIQLDGVNGQPINSNNAPDAGQGQDDQLAQLKAQAAQMPQSY